jgi:predicted RNA-binding protein
VDEESWDIFKSSNLITINNKDTFQKISKNDRILVYVSSISKIMGLYGVISKEKEEITINDKQYSYKFDLNLLEFFDKSINFKDIVPKLDFITNKKRWYTHIGGVKDAKRISLKDYTTLIRSLV